MRNEMLDELTEKAADALIDTPSLLLHGDGSIVNERMSRVDNGTVVRAMFKAKNTLQALHTALKNQPRRTLQRGKTENEGDED